MRLHHFTLCFVMIALSIVLTTQIRLVMKMQEEGNERMEYDCLVAAVNAAVDVAFAAGENTVTRATLLQTEEVFFQTLGVLHEGKTDRATWKVWQERVPCLAVFEERGYYLYCFVAEKGYIWSELMPYQEGRNMEAFFSEAEEAVTQYHNLQFASSKRYCMGQAEKGIWEQSIVPPCVLAVYAPQTNGLSDANAGFLYAASGRGTEEYFVTDDNYCHLQWCVKCKEGRIVARYTSQKESAEDGAYPCEICLK